MCSYCSRYNEKRFPLTGRHASGLYYRSFWYSGFDPSFRVLDDDNDTVFEFRPNFCPFCGSHIKRS